ncbi:FUSC family protein [Streptomyces sp. NPDC002004]
MKRRPTKKPAVDRTAAFRRAVRVTAAASVGFYLCLYAFHQPVMAIYALFGAVSLGALSQIPGSGRQRARVMLGALPVGWLLVALGTALAVRTWAAVLGMLVVGFVLAFAAVAGPRPAGAAPGLLLFYILPCFPPYAPDTLWARMAGLTLGVCLLAAAELLLMPAPRALPYRLRLAASVAVAGQAAADLADPAFVPPGTWSDQLGEAAATLRLSAIPPAERPAGPSRSDRGFAQAAIAVRRLLDHLERLGTSGARPGEDPACAVLLRHVRDVCDAAVTLLRDGGTPPPAPGTPTVVAPDAPVALTPLGPVPVTPGPTSSTDPEPPSSGGASPPRPTAAAAESFLLEESPVLRFQRERLHRAQERTGLATPREVAAALRQSAVLGAAEAARVLETATRVGVTGRRTEPVPPRRLFWYVEAGTPDLWLKRLEGNLTRRSVALHNALRTGLGLGIARLAAGALDLSHGFWVLLTVLTLSRTTAVQTWSAVRVALLGTLAGAVAAGALLVAAGPHTEIYAALLAPAMLAAFALGAILGVGWGQALFTLVVSIAFAQLAPATWQLAQTRMLDVLTGSCIGLLCSLIAWPAGARHEVRLVMAELLHAVGTVITDTTAVVLGPLGTPPTVDSARYARNTLRLAETSLAQYRSEPDDPDAPLQDWHSVLLTASHALLGAHWLPRYDRVPPAPGLDTAWATTTADGLALACERLGDHLTRGGTAPRPPPPPHARLATAGAALPMLADLAYWMDTITVDLGHIPR